MTPRKYTLDQRAANAAATRERIIDAAVAVYREIGVSASTIQAIARRADVARGTVINQFGNADAVLEAVLDRAVVEVEFPSERDLDGANTPDARVRRFVEVMYRFFERGTDWWQVFYADLQLPALQARQQRYNEIVAAFHAAAFGSLADDRIVAAAVRAFIDYPPWYALKAGGLTLDESIELIGDALGNIARQRRTPSKVKAR